MFLVDLAYIYMFLVDLANIYMYIILLDTLSGGKSYLVAPGSISGHVIPKT